jgi:hypothetical protein
MDFKNKNKINIYQIKNFTLFKKNMFFINFFFLLQKKTVHKEYLPYRSLYLQLKNGINTNLPASNRHVFPFFLSIFNSD